MINIKNVEEIFLDNKIWKKIPDLRHLKDQWQISKISPALRPMGKKALLDFLNSVKEVHKKALEEYFNTDVVVEKLDYNSVKNIKFSIQDDISKKLNLMEYKNELYSYFSIYRDNDDVYMTFWR